MYRTNFLIIGSGIAGLNFALNAAEKGKVTIITKKRVAESNTNYAQGGIAAVLDKTDSPERHIEDTLKAGAYHNKLQAVRFMVEHSREAITRLIRLGVEFEKESFGPLAKTTDLSPIFPTECKTAHCLKLTREGGHDSPRIAYVGDYTGAEIERILVKRVREHKNITIIENAFAVDLITRKHINEKEVIGAYFIKNQNSKSTTIDYVIADTVVLATGGIGQTYKFTTNPEIATGDGIAMAIRAGAKTKDMEFIQFHPTALNKPRKPLFLLSEALRGEGAKLINSKKEEFMSRYDKRKDLAPRDIVARAIYNELKNGQVYLTFKSANKKAQALKTRFPKIYAELKKYKLDLTKDKIPVVPAVHYICGGIVTDLHGKTSLDRLYAIGEAACTGVHGANRLASNSLLEAFVFSNQILKKAKPLSGKSLNKLPKIKTRILQVSILKSKTNLTGKSSIKNQIREIMWTKAGIVRTEKELKEGLKDLTKLRLITKPNSKSKTKKASLTSKLLKPTEIREILEARNMLNVSTAILKSAIKRKKSLGCHFISS